MDEKEILKQILTEMIDGNVLLPGHWALAGSGVMIMHNIERNKPMGDVDIFMATRDWFHAYDICRWDLFTTEPDDVKRRCDPPYLFKTIQGLEVNIFFQWRDRGIGDIDTNLWVHNIQEVDGWPCVPLRLLYDWKREVGRAKDMDDIRILSQHLEEA